MTFERAFRLYSILLLLAGFFALFAAGGVSPLLATLYVLTVLVLARLGTRTIPHILQFLMVFAVLGWFAVDVLFFSSVVPGLVHVLLLISLIKLGSARSGRDYLLLYLIAFVFVLLATAYTISAFFLVTLAVFIFLAIQAFMLLETRPAQLQNQRARFPHKAYLQMSLVVTVLIMLFAIPIFILIPRGGMAFLGTQADTFVHMTGFSDRVTLGELGRILNDTRIVMRVKTDLPPEQLPPDLKWRGIGLDYFDGRAWLNTRRTEEQIFLDEAYNGYLVPRTRRQNETQLGQVFFVEPFTNTVFGAPDIISIRGFREDTRIVRDGNDSLSYRPARTRRLNYTVFSDIMTREQRLGAVRHASGAILGMERYLQLPKIDPRIPALAERIVAGRQTAVGRALAIEDYLRRNYRYSLDNLSAGADDPLADFLFEHRAGHCEYFSAAQAVMMRVVGIPCRVVNGFRRGEYNSWSDNFVVRQSDAHSWVEGYFPGAGWLEFDSTPAAPAPERYFLARFSSQWLDVLDAFWTEVITFDRVGQVSLFRSTGRELFRVLTGAGQITDWLRELGRNLNDELLAARLPDIALVFWLIPGCLLVFALAYRYRRYLRLFVKRRIFRLDSEQLAPEYYLELLYVLQRRGLKRERWETPLEFATRARARLDSTIPVRVTELYYGNRFGRLPLEAAELAEIYQGLRLLRRKG